MRIPTATVPSVRYALLAACSLALAACEFRQESPPEQDSGAPPPVTATATPTPSPSASAVSIIRQDIAPEKPMALPPEPVEIVIPFPDGSELTTRAERLLAGALESRAMEEGWPVVLSGHTDSSGNDQANLRASRARAEEVAAWLVERGVADERIEVIAFGEQNPIAPNALPDGSPNEQGRRTNRRVELRIAPPQGTGDSRDSGRGEGAAENEGA